MGQGNKINKKEILITVAVLIGAILIGMVLGKVLYESMYGAI